MMAQSNSPERLAVTDYAWGRQYVGSRAALLRAEVGVELRFPGDVGNRRTMQTYRVGDRKVWIRRTGSDLYRVSVYDTAPETRARRARGEYRRSLTAGQGDQARAARQTDVAFQAFMRKVIDGTTE